MEAIGTIFTNEKHAIVFIDDLFQEFWQQANEIDNGLIGTSIATLLNMDVPSYHQFIEPMITVSGKHTLPLTLNINTTLSYPTMTKAFVNHDTNSQFMGIDYAFYSSTLESDLSILTQVVPANMVRELIRFYSQTQLDAILSTVKMIAGAHLAQYLVTMLLETGEQFNWNISIVNQKMKLEADNPIGAYSGLLNKVTAYAYRIVGRSLIVAQIEKNNKKASPQTFEYIDQNWHTNL